MDARSLHVGYVSRTVDGKIRKSKAIVDDYVYHTDYLCLYLHPKHQ